MAKKKVQKVNLNLLSETDKARYLELQDKFKKERAESALKKLETKASSQKDTRISVKPISKGFKVAAKLARRSPSIPKVKFRPPQLTQAQRFLKTFMGGGERTFGTGQNLPVINHALTSGYGLTKHPQQKETGGLFGFNQ